MQDFNVDGQDQTHFNYIIHLTRLDFQVGKEILSSPKCSRFTVCLLAVCNLINLENCIEIRTSKVLVGPGLLRTQEILHYFLIFVALT